MLRSAIITLSSICIAGNAFGQDNCEDFSEVLPLLNKATAQTSGKGKLANSNGPLENNYKGYAFSLKRQPMSTLECKYNDFYYDLYSALKCNVEVESKAVATRLGEGISFCLSKQGWIADKYNQKKLINAANSSFEARIYIYDRKLSVVFRKLKSRKQFKSTEGVY